MLESYGTDSEIQIVGKFLRRFGPNQFAYRAEHGCRDFIVLAIILWLLAFVRSEKVATNYRKVQQSISSK